MIACSRGDVVLVSFVFSDESGVKKRPAVVISSETYNTGRQEAVISAITSKTERPLVCDHLISGWKRAGLLFPSVATGIIKTITQGMVIGKLGVMPDEDMRQIDQQLSIALALPPAASRPY